MVRWSAIAGSVVVVAVGVSACSLVDGPAGRHEAAPLTVSPPARARGDHFWWDDEDGGGPTSDTPAPTTVQTPSTEDDRQTVVGPGGISVQIPASWTVGGSPSATNQQASDPSDPAVFVRFGAAVPPDVPLLTEIQSGESGNPNVQNGYRRLQLVELSFLGQPAVDWEFTFVKDGVARHAFGRYWRLDGLTYVIYLSAPVDRWDSVDWIFQIMSDSVTVY